MSRKSQSGWHGVALVEWHQLPVDYLSCLPHCHCLQMPSEATSETQAASYHQMSVKRHHQQHHQMHHHHLHRGKANWLANGQTAHCSCKLCGLPGFEQKDTPANSYLLQEQGKHKDICSQLTTLPLQRVLPLQGSSTNLIHCCFTCSYEWAVQRSESTFNLQYMQIVQCAAS